MTLTLVSGAAPAAIRIYRFVTADSTPTGKTLPLGWRGDDAALTMRIGDAVVVGAVGIVARIYAPGAAFYAKTSFVVERPLYRFGGVDGPPVAVREYAQPDPVPLGEIAVSDLYIALETNAYGASFTFQVSAQ